MIVPEAALGLLPAPPPPEELVLAMELLEDGAPPAPPLPIVEEVPLPPLEQAAAAVKRATRAVARPSERKALRFAWRVCAHVKSNTIIFTDNTRTLAIGAGQMSRVDAVKTAVVKAQAAATSEPALAGSVVASDAFFPFRDGLDAVVAAGATAVVQPGGSVKDDEVIAAADEHGLAMVFTGRRHFRH